MTKLEEKIDQAQEDKQRTIVDMPPDVSGTSSAGLQGDARPILVFVNPNSGRGKSIRIFRKSVSEFLDSHKINHEVFVTTADFRIKNYLESKSTSELLRFRAIVLISGDGLVYDLVNAIKARADWQQVMTLPIGIIPTGSGNGLAHTLIGHSGVQARSSKEAVQVCCQQITQTETCLSDLVRLSYSDEKTVLWSFLSIGWGLLANIDVDSDWLRRLGELRFTIYGLVRSLTCVSYRGRLSYKPADEADQIQLLQTESNSDSTMYDRVHTANSLPQKDGKILSMDQPRTVDSGATGSDDGWIHIEDKFTCLYAVHQSHISKTTRFAPKSTPSDGLIYLSYIRGKLNPCQVINYLTSVDDGSHAQLPFVKVVPVKTFKFQPLEPGKVVVDGERIDWDLSQGPLTAELVPKALKLLWSNNQDAGAV